MFSRICYVLCTAIMLYACLFHYPKWNAEYGENTFGWDVSGYYWYLPSTFIYHDLKQQKFGDSIIDKYGFTSDFSQSTELPSGNRVNVYSSGMAVMYLPFFTVAHLLAKPLGYPADGFSTPYAFSITIGSILMALIGLLYFRKLMLHFYRDRTVGILLLLLVFGTNYLNYAAIDGSLTHNWLFTIYVFILLNTYYFYKAYQYKYAIRIGLLIGLAILTRPSEIVAIIIPLLWGMESITSSEIIKRFRFLLSQWKKIAVTAVCIIAIGSIQVVYWLYVTGKPFVYSYGQDKGFSWLRPHFINYIFSYRSGWLTYTPLVILFFIGIIPFLKNGRNKVAILSFFMINLYIVSAWDIWWYGGTGGRAMIQSYPVILFPFATLIDVTLNRKILAWVISPILLLLVYFNIWFIYNEHTVGGLYDSESMTKQFYWHSILRSHVRNDVFKLKDTDEIFDGTPQNKKLLYSNGFESDTIPQSKYLLPIEGKVSVLSDAAHAYSPASEFAYAKNKAQWLRAEATFACKVSEWTPWKMTQFIVRFMNDGQVVKERMIRVNRFLKHKQKRDIYIDVHIPVEPFNKVAIFFWNPGSEQQLLIDNLRVWEFSE